MKAGKSSAVAAVLPRPVDDRLAGAEGRLVGGDAPDQFHQLHHRNRVHEMEPHEPFRPVGAAGKARDGNRRGVGGQDRLGFQMRQQVLEDRRLHRFAFGRRLDHEVGRSHVGQLQCGANAAHRLRFRVLGDLAAPDLPAEVLLDQRDRAVERLLADVGHDDVIARQRADMRDAVAHLARPDDADRLDLHNRPFAYAGPRTIGPSPEDAQAV
jgi:hypothetical protein